MRNYELLKKIWDIIHINQARPETKVLTIENLLKRERPELKEDNFWDGGHLDAADSPSFESKMEEMKKYPHQDNHMD